VTCRLRRALAALGLVWPLLGGAALDLRGELDVQGAFLDNSADSLDAALGEGSRRDLDLRLRLMASGVLASGWGLDIAWLGEARRGGDVALARRQRGAEPPALVDPQRTSLLRLGHTLTDRGNSYGAQRLDRLAVSYSGAQLVVRLGRQALTWGGGLVFHPMDLFNPFPPDATYTTYKPGTDMLYGQWLLDSGADLQGVLVPRRDAATGRLRASQSSAGLKWHGLLDPDLQLGLDLLLAQDYGDRVLGLALSGPAGGATWTLELVPTLREGGDLPISLLVNGQYAWDWGGRGVTGYLEYFRNGFGVGGDGHAWSGLPQPLRERLARGQLFTLSRDYLAAGVDLQWSPLLSLKPTGILDLDGGSALLLGQAIYSLSQNTSLTCGLQWAWGRRGTDYGGLETAPGSGIYAVPARQLYGRLTWYF
jgi:hypothetical protein